MVRKAFQGRIFLRDCCRFCPGTAYIVFAIRVGTIEYLLLVVSVTCTERVVQCKSLPAVRTLSALVCVRPGEMSPRPVLLHVPCPTCPPTPFPGNR